MTPKWTHRIKLTRVNFLRLFGAAQCWSDLILSLLVKADVVLYEVGAHEFFVFTQSQAYCLLNDLK